MGSGQVPATINRDWNRLYIEFPETYDRFALSTIGAVDFVCSRLGIAGTVADVASGTGKSAFELASRLTFVYAIEPWRSMREASERKLAELRVRNVKILEGSGQQMPLRDKSVDHVLTFFGVPIGLKDETGGLIGPRFFSESNRVSKAHGYLVVVTTQPNWSAGDLTPLVGPEVDSPDHRQLEEQGFQYVDFEALVEYGSVDEAVSTYGFIYGEKAIRHLRRHKKHSITWPLRAYFTELGNRHLATV